MEIKRRTEKKEEIRKKEKERGYHKRNKNRKYDEKVWREGKQHPSTPSHHQ
jgi:hypothetical protein